MVVIYYFELYIQTYIFTSIRELKMRQVFIYNQSDNSGHEKRDIVRPDVLIAVGACLLEHWEEWVLIPGN